MKKIFLLLSIVSVFGLTGCSSDDDNVDYDTIAAVTEHTVNMTYNSTTGKYNGLVTFTTPMYDSDVVLVYRLTDDGEGFTVWQQIPRTIYMGADEVDYDFNFTADDVLLTVDANFDLATAPQFTQGQTFRIVQVPGYFASTVDTNDFEAVMSALSEKQGKTVQIETIK